MKWLDRFYEERKAAIDAEDDLGVEDRERLKSDLVGWYWRELLATGLFRVVGLASVEGATTGGSVEFSVADEG